MFPMISRSAGRISSAPTTGDDLSRTRWLLNTIGMAQTIPDLQAARGVTDEAQARRQRKPPAVSSLVAVERAVRRRGAERRPDRGVG
jgi:hypothetical protein